MNNASTAAEALLDPRDAKILELETIIAALEGRDVRITDELATLRQFRDDVVTVLERGDMVDQIRLNVRLNSYSERRALLIEGILADEAAAIRARKEGA